MSLAFASLTVCHCMLLGASAPPRFSGRTWSMTYPGHAPEVFPVEGQGCDFLNSLFACCDRLILPWLSRLAEVEYALRSPALRWRTLECVPVECDLLVDEREVLWCEEYERLEDEERDPPPCPRASAQAGPSAKASAAATAVILIMPPPE